MPPPVALTAEHLVHALVPAAPAGAAGAEPVVHVELAIDRVDLLAGVAGAWRDRLPRLPDPPRRETLDELVQAARRRLRADRARLDLEELDARRFVLQRVRDGLVP